MENKVVNHIFNDILGKVLELSEKPSQFGEYLTGQIRELVGARTIVISVKTETGQSKIFSVFPTRRTEWANQSALLQLADISLNFKTIQYLDNETSEENITYILQQLEIDKAIAIPLIAANRPVGSILLLDIMDLYGTDSVISLLNQLSGILALVIRNSSLFQNMEELVASRTEELQKRNDELEKAIKRAEQSELQARDILQTAFDGFWMVDIKGRFLEVNEVACKMLGYTREEMLNMSVPDIVFEESEEQAKTRIEEITQKGEGRFDSKHRCRDGKIIDVELSVKVQPAHNLLVVFISDITERKQAEVAMHTAKEQAEESDRLKSAFLANMSHEIRTPMNGILGFAELLKEPGLSGEQQQEYIQIIEKGGARMLNIINDIVDISKIESGQMKVSISETKVNEQIEYLLKFFKPEAEKKGILFDSKCPLSVKDAVLLTDREKLYAILTNLIKNAIKYTKSGSIEFGYNLDSVSDKECLDSTIKTIEFFVKDTGIGIPYDRQGAIFERFIQADIADKMARQGAGLGLAISKAYVQMLGGEIWVESEEGKGSTFHFTLPFYSEAKEQEITKNKIQSFAKENKMKILKILIAEDDDSSANLMTIMVGKFGKEILRVNNGVEAVEICRNNPDIDLVLMDIQMPEMNGYEATQHIRQFNSDVVIIAQTAFALSGDNEKAIEAGCTDYITKPIKRDKLMELIGKYFSK